MQSEMQAKENM